MRVLALEPYYGGSHRAFLDGWRRGSRHEWTLLELPAYKWKWRMRHAAVTFAEEVAARVARGEAWDAVFASDMLDLAQFRGLAPEAVRRLPMVVYFHENQLTYPVQVEKERDLHFALTNFTTALAADEVWMNSAFHQGELLEALPRLLRKMPDHRPLGAVDAIAAKMQVEPPGFEPPAARPPGPRRPGPLRVLWAARWEFDKDPDTFFRAVGRALGQGVELRLSVLGESFRRVPAVFERAQKAFAGSIERWGFQERDEYERALADCEVFVSTAIHEFFGLTAVEAIAAGAYPLLPQRLSYPEILAGVPAGRRDAHLYDGGAVALAARLEELATAAQAGDVWDGREPISGAVERFAWPRARPRLDAALERACGDA